MWQVNTKHNYQCPVDLSLPRLLYRGQSSTPGRERKKVNATSRDRNEMMDSSDWFLSFVPASKRERDRYAWKQTIDETIGDTLAPHRDFYYGPRHWKSVPKRVHQITTEQYSERKWIKIPTKEDKWIDFDIYCTDVAMVPAGTIALTRPILFSTIGIRSNHVERRRSLKSRRYTFDKNPVISNN